MSKLNLINILKNTIVEQVPIGLYTNYGAPSDDYYIDVSTGEVKKNIIEPSKKVIGNSSVFDTSCTAPLKDQTLVIIRGSEGFTDKPTWDQNNYRIGFGSENVTYEDGSTEKLPNYKEEHDCNNPSKCTHPSGKNKYGVKWKDFRITKEDAKRDFDRLIEKIFNNIENKLGSDIYEKTPDCVLAILASLHYNGGHVPSLVLEATKTGDYCSVADNIERVLLTSKDGSIDLSPRRKKEAKWVRECACNVNVSDEEQDIDRNYTTTVSGSYTAAGKNAIWDALHSFNRRSSDKFGGLINEKINKGLREIGSKGLNADIKSLDITIDDETATVNWVAKLGVSTDGYSYTEIDSRGSAGGGESAVNKQLNDMHNTYHSGMVPVEFLDFNEDVKKCFHNDGRKKENCNGKINIRQKFFKYRKK
jgi:GH24 family phage-related lysozyme (muramidase)